MLDGGERILGRGTKLIGEVGQETDALATGGCLWHFANAKQTECREAAPNPRIEPVLEVAEDAEMRASREGTSLSVLRIAA